MRASPTRSRTGGIVHATVLAGNANTRVAAVPPGAPRRARSHTASCTASARGTSHRVPTVQPSSTSPTRSESGTITSVMNSWQILREPLIISIRCTSTRTGWIGSMKTDRPRCLGTSSCAGEAQPPIRPPRSGGPHLGAVQHPTARRLGSQSSVLRRHRSRRSARRGTASRAPLPSRWPGCGGASAPRCRTRAGPVAHGRKGGDLHAGGVLVTEHIPGFRDPSGAPERGPARHRRAESRSPRTRRRTACGWSSRSRATEASSASSLPPKRPTAISSAVAGRRLAPIHDGALAEASRSSSCSGILCSLRSTLHSCRHPPSVQDRTDPLSVFSRRCRPASGPTVKRRRKQCRSCSAT